jgi:hypothetical protein
MNRAATFCVLTIVSFGLWTSVGSAVELAGYDPMGGAPNPNTQGWTWNGVGNVAGGGGTLLLNGGNGNPPMLFTDTVPTNVFFDPWSFTGRYRFAGNSQEEFGRMMFVDDGTNIWHLSFLNTGNDPTDGIYNGGNPIDPNPVANTATKIWAEPVGAGPGGTPENKPFDGFFDYAIVDPDGAGGLTPRLHVNGADVSPVVSLLAEPSRFPAGTIGFGSLNIHESGFIQIQRLVFDGNPNAVPEPSAVVLIVASMFGLVAIARRNRS